MTALLRRRVAAAGLAAGAALLLLGAVVKLVVDPAGEGANGAGFTYRGQFYGLSDAEVRPDRLGEVLDEDVPFQESTAQVRLITGVSAEVAVAARVHRPGVGAGGSLPAWLLLSPEPDLAADPWSDAELSLALQPRP